MSKNKDLIIMKKKKELSPPQILVIGFAVFILVGALLLSLPISSTSGHSMNFLHALFTSTSAVCVTGLSVFDPGTALTPFGQTTLISLIQVGGLGFMTMTALTYQMVRKRSSLKDRIMIKDSFNESSLSGMVSMTKYAAAITCTCEFIGCALFATRLIPMYGIEKGLFLSLFQSISSFCNAGFDVYGLNSSLEPFSADPLMMVTTMSLIVLGGLGFLVILELKNKIINRNKKKLSLHTRIVLIATGVLLISGFLIFLIAESNNPKTLGAPNVTNSEKVLGALFQSVTSRTAGFYAMPQASMLPISKAVTTVLMFIGGAPAGAAGGIKVTTVLVVVMFLVSILRGRDDVEIKNKRINRQLVYRAIAIFTIGVIVIIVMSVLITILEDGKSNVALKDVLFEVTSAFGTVGLSLGMTPNLSAASHIALIIIMLGGRVGFLTFTLALARRLEKQKINVKYPEEKIIIG